MSFFYAKTQTCSFIDSYLFCFCQTSFYTFHLNSFILSTQQTLPQRPAGAGSQADFPCHSEAFVLRAARISTTEHIVRAEGEFVRMVENGCADRKGSAASHGNCLDSGTSGSRHFSSRTYALVEPKNLCYSLYKMTEQA